MTRTLVLIGAVLAASSGGVLAADVAAGEQSFKKCLVCHSIGADAKNKVGTAQNGLDGRKAGTVEGFNYSDANKNSGMERTDFQAIHQSPAGHDTRHQDDLC